MEADREAVERVRTVAEARPRHGDVSPYDLLDAGKKSGIATNDRDSW
jgi:hypothetical protein